MTESYTSSPILMSSRFKDVGELVARLDALSIHNKYANGELIRRGLFSLDLLKDPRILYHERSYFGAQVLGHFLEHNDVNGHTYPSTVEIKSVSDFLDTRVDVIMQAVGKLLSYGSPVLERGKIKIPFIFDVYNAIHGSVTETDIVKCMQIVEPILKSLLRRLGWYITGNGDFDDLRSAGYMGLMDAARKYDPSRGVKFATYAEHRIRGSMLDYMKSNLPLTRGTRSMKRKVESAEDFLQARLERRATEDEVAAYLGMELEKLQYHKTRIRTKTETFIGLVNTNGKMPVESFENSDTLDSLIDRDTAAIVREVVAQLQPRLRTLVQKYYYEGLTMKEIGTHLGVNESRVSQLHARAIQILRSSLRGKISGDILESLN